MTAQTLSQKALSKAACIGGGVIGAGWVARLLLNGIDVDVYDPAPETRRMVEEVLANARSALAALTAAPLPAEGKLRFAGSIAEAVAGSGLVQESVPERMDLKRRVLTEIDAAAPPDALIGSSTSGFLPSALQDGLAYPERLFVAHPFNPVYLLPLVEIVGGERTGTDALARACALYETLGMKPVTIGREIEAFVGDRLLEALWREALWLVNDGIATVEQIDDIIRYSFGLRWAQMGLFQTYRIAGGEAGMRHFLAQFGPALHWPWTKLTDVPDLTDELIDRIARQSDEQAKGRSIRELERVRDDNLVAIIRALARQQQGKGWGAGELLNGYEARLKGDAIATDGRTPEDGPLRLLEVRVLPEWIDYNGHMTESRYLEVFGNTTDALLARIGVDAAYLASGKSFYTVETHIMHRGEAKRGETLSTSTQILSFDEKRLHLFHRILRGKEEVASAEQMLLHVDTRLSKAAPAEFNILDRVRAIATAQADLPRPAAAGRFVGQRAS
jgi:carnitine 3-dehydrogenase